MSRSKSRASAWLLPAAYGLGTRATPFHLVVIGGEPDALIADYLDRPELVSEEGESLPGPEEFRKSPFPVLSRTGYFEKVPAAAGLLESLMKEPAGPKLLKWEGRIAAPKAGDFEGLLVVTYGDAPEGMSELLKPWEDRAFWVAVRDQLDVRRLVDGKIESKTLARIEAKIVVFKGWNFLQPLAPVKRAPFTFEEPPKKFYRG
jgi:hypothetical protein